MSQPPPEPPKRPKRTATPAQRAYLAKRREWTRRRRWLWKNKPTLMEAGRSKATKAAAEKHHNVNQHLLVEVGTWPHLMTPAQLDAQLDDLPYHRKGKKRRMSRASLVRRLRSLGLISYDPASNAWTNLCTFPSRQ